ncbi:VOC family protein [Saccharospirillum impatiens]|uniref:VOC family protein n=1 Tax=Saccharospirillum impatiens TaxID=169438 RepID=UPI0003F81A3F|nr:VOC family protein [Saccharospirillum impatiens]
MNRSNPLVWLDIPVLDLDRAIGFYQPVLDWVLVDQRPQADMAVFRHSKGEVAVALILQTSTPGGLGPLPYLNCHGRLEQALARVEPYGGSIEQPLHPLTPFGFRAVIRDSEGNRVALHSMAVN